MQYLTTVLRPFRAVFLTLGAMVFVSGCQTTSGAPVVCKDGYTATRDARCAPNAAVVKKPRAAQKTDY